MYRKLERTGVSGRTMRNRTRRTRERESRDHGGKEEKLEEDSMGELYLYDKLVNTLLIALALADDSTYYYYDQRGSSSFAIDHLCHYYSSP